MLRVTRCQTASVVILSAEIRRHPSSTESTMSHAIAPISPVRTRATAPLVPLIAVWLIVGCASAASGPTTVAPQSNTLAAGPAEDVMLPVRYDASTGKVFLTIRRPGEEMLYLNTLAGGVGSLGLDRGQVGAEAVVRFERNGAQVHLIQTNTTHRAVAGNPALRRSVEESFPRSVLASLPVVSDGPAGIVVDATDFFLSDVFNVIGEIRSARNGTVRIDRDRSAIIAANTKAFPNNTEIRSALSYVTDDPGPELRSITPDGRTIGLQQHHSFVRLPADPLAIRQFDPRAGLFASNPFDFAQGLQGDYRQRGVVRWRLEPSDTAAYLRGELVRPVKPIVYYLDPGIPAPYRTAFVQGVIGWKSIYQVAGWGDEFRVLPCTPGIDPVHAWSS